YDRIEYPQPTLFLAVEPKAKGDEEKIGTSLNRLTEEDPTFIVERNSETKQLLIGGQGNMQLAVIVDKLKNAFGVEVNLTSPKVAYRETIKGTASVQGRHKKQSGGAGQYGDVHIRFEPIHDEEEDFIFEEEVFGGAVPKNFFPAVEKGLRESIEEGVLAGYPVVNLKATLFDGSYHPVDSNEMAFKIAASLAFKKGMEAAKPILLEPIMKVEVLIPENYMGDVMGDMNKRRGRILGMEPQADGSQLVIAEAPQAELFEYAIDLRSMTQARGSFTMEFIRYDEVPSEISQKIIEETKAEKE
ncbi:MAG: elongation factor G, partial [Tissierellia bacterium]|nr:elongation factor G [Tissierellia bacterium]